VKTNHDLYRVLLGERAPFAFDDPRFSLKAGGAAKVIQTPRLTKAAALDGSRAEWPAVPGTRIGPEGLVLGQSAKDFEATYRLAWDDANLYVYVDVTDLTPAGNDRNDDELYAGDCIEVFTGFENLAQGGALQFGDRQVMLRAGKVGAGKSAAHFLNAPKPYAVRSAVVPAVDGRGYTVEAAIPFEALGFRPKAGQEILFDLAIADAGAAGRQQIAWNGTARNSKDRGGWGRAAFTE